MPILRAVLILLASSLAAVHAQTGTTPATRGRIDPVQREQQRKVDMEIIENALNRSPTRRSGRYPPQVLEQIRDDFLRIQVVDRKVMHSLSTSEALDFELLAKAAGEIKKRAVRLKKNLELPAVSAAPARPAEEQVGPERLRSAVTTLSNMIDRFVSNPIFKESKLLDAKLSAQALQDIEVIIAISSGVKRTSQNLKVGAK